MAGTHPNPQVQALVDAINEVVRIAEDLQGNLNGVSANYEMKRVAGHFRAWAQREQHVMTDTPLPSRSTRISDEAPSIKTFDGPRLRDGESMQEHLDRTYGLSLNYYENIGENAFPVITLSSQSLVRAELANVVSREDLVTAERMALAWNFFLGLTNNEIRILRPARVYHIKRGRFDGLQRNLQATEPIIED